MKYNKYGSTMLIALLATAATAPLAYKGFHSYMGYDEHFGSFAWGCITNPGQNGALTQSSQFAAEKITAPLKDLCLNYDKNKTIRILECGPGTGVFTRKAVEILEDSGCDYLFDLVEVDAQWCEKLRAEFGGNKRIVIHEMLLQDLAVADETYDTVICGIPFSILTQEQVESIFDMFKKIIKPAGTLSYFKLIGSRLTQKVLFGDKKRAFQERQQFLKSFNNMYCYQVDTIWRNAPPIRVYHCQI